jgi:hypothetical protein
MPRLPVRSLLALVLLGAGLLPGAAPQPAAAQEAALPGLAQPTLAEVMRLDALFAVIAEEGAKGGRDIDAAMLGGTGGAGWTEAVARAYDPAALRAAYEAAVIPALAANPGAEAAALDFFGSDLGQRIVTLEIEARRTLLDDVARETAEVRAEKMGESRDPRLRLIRSMVEAGDMIELGTAATLSSYLAFNEGMAATGPAGLAGAPEDLSAEVYAQQAQVRADTTTWIITFMVLAYAPLSDAELEAYVDFAESPGGRAFNAALFAAFDQVMTPVSRAVGEAAGRRLAGRDI